MAVTRISELTTLITPTDDDVLIINDGSETKSITFGNLSTKIVDDVQTSASLIFSGTCEFDALTTFDGDLVVNGDVSFLGEVGGIEIDELVDVDTTATPPVLNQVLMWTSNNRWEPRTVSATGGAAVDSVNTQTGDVVLDADDIDDTSTTHKFATSVQLGLAETAVQPGDDISSLNNNANYIQSGSAVSALANDAAYIDAAGAPVQSVNGQTGVVTLDADSIDDTSTTHKFATSVQLGLAETAVQPVDSINALADVDTVSSAPEVGAILEWNGSNWVPSTGITTEWEVTNDGSTSYGFTGIGFDGTEANPDIYVSRGQRYRFKRSVSGHPFAIQSTSGTTGTLYNDGVTNNEVENDTLIWEVRMDAPSNLFYQCRSHLAMVGNIIVR